MGVGFVICMNNIEYWVIHTDGGTYICILSSIDTHPWTLFNAGIV